MSKMCITSCKKRRHFLALTCSSGLLRVVVLHCYLL
eukprot:jgi/Antlo1/857/1968